MGPTFLFHSLKALYPFNRHVLMITLKKSCLSSNSGRESGAKAVKFTFVFINALISTIKECL